MNPAITDDRRLRLLIVDDEQTNILVLGNLLGSDLYDLMVASSGHEAISLLQQTDPLPDLILLDIMMPDMDGYQLYRQLLSMPRCADIPVIFVTALDREQDILKGLELGAIDYITKPFSSRIVQHKVRNIAHLLGLMKALGEHVNKELLQHERMATLGQMVAGFTHDLATPLAVSHGAVAYLGQATGSLRTLLQQDEISEEEVFAKLDKLDESAQLAETNLSRAELMTGSFKRVSIDQTSEASRSFPLRQLLDDVVRSLEHTFKRSAITTKVECPPHLTLFGVPGALTQVITNLINNSWQHGFNQGERSGSINIEAHIDPPAAVIINYRDDGAGMTQSTRQQMFDRFFTTARERGGSGVGMHNVLMLVTQQMGGTISCESQPDNGVNIHIRVPLKLSSQEGE